jgi:hypothetical protein
MMPIKILVNFASVFVFCIELTVVNLVAAQNTLNPLLDMDDTLEVKKDVIFQDRLVERLSSLVQSVEQNILTVNNIFFVTKGTFIYLNFIRQMLSEMQNPPFVQLLKGKPYKEIEKTLEDLTFVFRNLSQNANARTCQ